VPGEDVELELACRRQQIVHLLAPLGVLVTEVHAAERNLGITSEMTHPPRIVHARLCRKGKDVDTFMSEPFSIGRHHCRLGREYHVEEGGCRKEVVEVWRVLLVPEDRGNSLLPERCDHLDESWPRGRRAHEMVGPGSVVSCPSTFDKEEVKTRR